MIKIINDSPQAQIDFINSIKERGSEAGIEIEKQVREIISVVKKGGDDALIEFSKKFEKSVPKYIEVTEDEIEKAYRSTNPALIMALKNAAENIKEYHSKQLQKGYSIDRGNGILLGQIVRPLKRVGIYVPGGTAAYPSTVLMNCITAKVAGVPEVIMVTPPDEKGGVSDVILAACRIAGVDRIFKIGGAQAVAALAYGTKTIPAVDKIVGPGNIYVATAKKILYGVVDIDMIAGPSEILIIADDSANPKYIAADMLSQAEHDVLASALLVTTSEEIAKKVKNEIEWQTEYLSRREIIEKSLADHSAILICESVERCTELANLIAPEHLEIMTNDPEAVLKKIENAGSVFLGQYSPEPLGDYYAGPNHVLPTSSTARFFSPLSVDSFIKKMSYIKYSKDQLIKAAEEIEMLAMSEGLSAHANSIAVRCEDEI